MLAPTVTGILRGWSIAACLLLAAGPALAQQPSTPAAVGPVLESPVPPMEPPPQAAEGETPPAEETPAEATWEEEPAPVAEEAGGFGDPFAEDEKEFSFNGYLQVQSGVFVSPDKAEYTDRGAALNHGDKLGKMSMARATLQLEADWKPSKYIQLHGILRAAGSLALKADKEAQLPNPKRLNVRNQLKGGSFVTLAEWIPKTQNEIINEVRDTWYNELDLRELYADIEATDWLSFRVGRQQVAWGETGQFRLLDVINPVDSTWHFSGVESFEDQRIPLWMLKTNIEVQALAGNLEIVWIPMLDKGEDLVTIPLTFVGAWGLPQPREVDMAQYRRKVFLYPERAIENSRIGGRWKGEAGLMTYSLIYYYTHVMSPPIPEFVYTPFGGGDLEVWLGFPRQHIVGASLEAAIPNPVTLNIKVEAAYEPDRTYPVSSQKAYTKVMKAAADFTPYKHDLMLFKNDVIGEFDNPKKHVFSYAVTLQRPTSIPWLNPEQTVMFIAQFMQTSILDYDSDDMAVEIPGYDTTKVQPHVFRLVGSMFTSYLHGMLTPRILGAFVFARDNAGETINQGGFLSVQLGMTFGNNWRLNLALNEFFGPDGYDGIGLFRDRDEVNLSVRYQF